MEGERRSLLAEVEEGVLKERGSRLEVEWW